MLHNPHVMRKVQSELDDVVGNRTPKLSDRQNLMYTEATLFEIQRMSNVAPVGIAHRAMANVNVGKYVIPKDAVILFNIFNVHTNPINWKEDPKLFKPERFLDENGQIVTNDSFIPFGK